MSLTKKITLVFLSTLTSMLFFTAVPIFAQSPAATTPEKAKIKVYYSESIGAGEKVYHLTACEKTKEYAPLRCSEDLLNYYDQSQGPSVLASQCKPNGKIIEGKLIKGCIQGDRKNEAGYPKIDLNTINQKSPQGCSDKAENQGYWYVPMWVVVETEDAQGNLMPETQWVRKQTIAWPDQDSLETKLDNDAGGSVRDTVAVPLYKSTLCLPWDVYSDGKGGIDTSKGQGGVDVEMTKLKGKALEFFDKVKAQGNILINAGCNNNNSGIEVTDDVENGILAATPYDDNPTFTCSIRERISGETGSDLLGQYISAIYSWAAGIIGIVAVFTIVYSGIQISMAGGDSAKLDSAKTRIMQSLVGMAILFLAGLILYSINPTFFTGG